MAIPPREAHAHLVWSESDMDHLNIETYGDVAQAWRRFGTLQRDRDPRVQLSPPETCRRHWCALLPDYMAIRHSEVLKA